MLKMFSGHQAQQFGRELANFLVEELGVAAQQPSPKFRSKAEKALTKASRRIDEFKSKTTLNWYQRSKAANAFLWALKERGCEQAYAHELAEWFATRV